MTADGPGFVTVTGTSGTQRVVDMPSAEPLP
jgi:hypothetical protein